MNLSEMQKAIKLINCTYDTFIGQIHFMIRVQQVAEQFYDIKSLGVQTEIGIKIDIDSADIFNFIHLTQHIICREIEVRTISREVFDEMADKILVSGSLVAKLKDRGMRGMLTPHTATTLAIMESMDRYLESNYFNNEYVLENPPLVSSDYDEWLRDIQETDRIDSMYKEAINALGTFKPF